MTLKESYNQNDINLTKLLNHHRYEEDPFNSLYIMARRIVERMEKIEKEALQKGWDAYYF